MCCLCIQTLPSKATQFSFSIFTVKRCLQQKTNLTSSKQEWQKTFLLTGRTLEHKHADMGPSGDGQARRGEGTKAGGGGLKEDIIQHHAYIIHANMLVIICLPEDVHLQVRAQLWSQCEGHVKVHLIVNVHKNLDHHLEYVAR